MSPKGLQTEPSGHTQSHHRSRDLQHREWQRPEGRQERLLGGPGWGRLQRKALPSPPPRPTAAQGYRGECRDTTMCWCPGDLSSHQPPSCQESQKMRPLPRHSCLTQEGVEGAQHPGR